MGDLANYNDVEPSAVMEEMVHLRAADFHELEVPPPPSTFKHTTPPPQSGASKYDFVKVRVWLDDHFFVLSRYLVCRSLIGTKIKESDAVRISLDLKKTLVDMQKVDIPQKQFEEYLYKVMTIHGYGQEHINRFRMMNRFYQKRIPLIILIAGTVCVGKSTIAAKLAERMNIPNVFQTDIIMDLLSEGENRFWARKYNSHEELIEEFHRQCSIVSEAVREDVRKALKEGKPIIIEGVHVNPNLYIADSSSKEGASKGGHEGAPVDPRQGITLPFVLTLNRRDHKRFMLANFRCPEKVSTLRQEQVETWLTSFQQLQDSLCTVQEADKDKIVFVENDVHSFEATVERLHAEILKRIEVDYKERNW